MVDIISFSEFLKAVKINDIEVRQGDGIMEYLFRNYKNEFRHFLKMLPDDPVIPEKKTRLLKYVKEYKELESLRITLQEKYGGVVGNYEDFYIIVASSFRELTIPRPTSPRHKSTLDLFYYKKTGEYRTIPYVITEFLGIWEEARDEVTKSSIRNTLTELLGAMLGIKDKEAKESTFNFFLKMLKIRINDYVGRITSLEKKWKEIS